MERDIPAGGMRGDPVLPLPHILTSTQMVSAPSKLILIRLTVFFQNSTFDFPLSGCNFTLFCQRMILLASSDHHQENTFATQWRNKRGGKKQCFGHWNCHPLMSQKLLCSDPIHTCCLASTAIRFSLVMFSGHGFKKKAWKILLLLTIMISLLLAFASGSGIEDFIHALESQDLAVEITSKENITEELKYNGAIKVSREGQVRTFAPILSFLPNSALIKQGSSFSCTEHVLDQAPTDKD